MARLLPQPLPTDNRRHITVVSPFFPHYRSALFRELDRSTAFLFEFIGATQDPMGSGIPGFAPEAVERFRHCPSRRIAGPLLWQSGAIRHALTTTADVIIFTGDVHHLSTWVAAAVARTRRIRVAFWTHGWKKPDAGIKRIVRKAFYKFASLLLLYGTRAHSIALQQGFSTERLAIIFNSMGAPLRLAGERSPTSESEAQHWVTISRLTEERRIELVLEMADHLGKRGHEVNLTVVGDGPLADQLKERAHSRALPVTFLGAVYDQDETLRILASSDICVIPGDAGLSVIHALSAGCPVATHDDDGSQGPEVEAIEHGVTGLRIPMHDTGAAAQQIWDFVASGDRSALQEACLAEVARRWTPSAHALAITSALKRLL